MKTENVICDWLHERGAQFIRFVDISGLAESQSRSYPTAVLFGLYFAPEYIERINSTVEIDDAEFDVMEEKVKRIADGLAEFLCGKGFCTHSQSDENLELHGEYNMETFTTVLPHKTIAIMGGLGWIGKNDLLVTQEHGCGVSMCSVLTNAPLKTVCYEPMESQCGKCTACQKVCPYRAIKGNVWQQGTPRDRLVDVFHCKYCLKCLAICPFTKKSVRMQGRDKGISQEVK